LICQKRAEEIRNAIQRCTLCEGLSKAGAICIDQKESGLDYAYPQERPIQILFVGESPPAPGRGFFYDRGSTNTMFRDKLFKLINAAGPGAVSTLADFSEKGYYLADALNCRWDKTKGSSLSAKVLENCSIHLSDQIRLFEPRYIVAMGRYAQNSLKRAAPLKAIEETGIPADHILEMSFILVAPNGSDEQRIAKLERISVSQSY